MEAVLGQYGAIAAMSTTVTKKLECIGDDAVQALRSYEQFERMFFPQSYRSSCGVKSRAWVAIIKHYSQGKFFREFLRGYKDYSEANSKGSRGVYKYYYLEEGPIYEVSNPVSWKNTHRYFCRIENGEEIEMSKEEVIEYLQAQPKHIKVISSTSKQTLEMTEEEYLSWVKKNC